MLDVLGNPIGWEGKTLQNAIESLARRHQYAPIEHLSWSLMLDSYIIDMLDLIKVLDWFLFFLSYTNVYIKETWCFTYNLNANRAG